MSVFGQAYKCDECGRVQFVASRLSQGMADAPPEGWLALSQAGAPDVVWPMWHFDQAECARDFLIAKTDMQIQALDAEDGEVVLSSWEQPVDEQEG